jgi:predicted nucleic acid-binding protein
VTLAAVADTGPLIHLAEVDALSLLSTIDDLSVPKTVHDELDVGGVPNGLDDLKYALVDVTLTNAKPIGWTPTRRLRWRLRRSAMPYY